MKLRRLRLRCWRGIDECDISFNERGVTIVEGPNESGKSSLLEAFDILLDELDTTTKAVVKSVKQVHRDEASEVEAEFTTGPSIPSARREISSCVHRPSLTRLGPPFTSRHRPPSISESTTGRQQWPSVSDGNFRSRTRREWRFRECCVSRLSRGRV